MLFIIIIIIIGRGQISVSGTHICQKKTKKGKDLYCGGGWGVINILKFSVHPIQSMFSLSLAVLSSVIIVRHCFCDI
jgi:hypothetical protein